MEFTYIKEANKKIIINDITFGDGHFNVIAGPCSVESVSQMESVIETCLKNGVSFIRGGAFKPRTNPNTFQGLKEEAIKILKDVKDKYNICVVTELTSEKYVHLYDDIDVIQVGARNMQNYELLKTVGKLDKPVILKRSPGATVKEWISAAEYIIKEGNKNVILCERGIRTFETSTRYTLDLNSVIVAKELTSLPVIVDPSHAVGDARYVAKLAKAAKAVGADGLLIEIHPNPKEALSDPNQQLSLDSFSRLMEELD